MLLSIPNSPEADQLVNLLCLSRSHLWGMLERLDLPVTQTLKTKNAQLYSLTWYISCLTYFCVSHSPRRGDSKAGWSVGLKYCWMIDTALIVDRLTMAFSSRKPDGWRCLLPVSSGPYTDLGSANTMGLVLKALGSGAPDIFNLEEWLQYSNIIMSSTWRSDVFPIVKLWLSIDQGRCPVSPLVRISRGL